jgi:hypothetical protein
MDSILAGIVGSGTERRRLALSCFESIDDTTVSCGHGEGFLDDNQGQENRRKLQVDPDTDGCDQCSGEDDDYVANPYDGTDEPFDVSSADDVSGGGLGAVLSYTITAQFPDGEDPLAVMNEVEDRIIQFFSDKENARVTWITKARELGSDIPEDTQVIFSSPEVEEDSVHISRPGDFLDHHYSSNSNVRLGTWIGAAVAGVGLMMSAKYGMKAYQLKHGADVIEQEKAAEWANVEEAAGEITMNPLAGGNSGGD